MSAQRAGPSRGEQVATGSSVAATGCPKATVEATSFTLEAEEYLSRQPWPGERDALKRFVAMTARGAGPIDDTACAIALYGERRLVNRWLASEDAPLPMPNRRRPPPLIAVQELLDLTPLLSQFEEMAETSMPLERINARNTALLLGLRYAGLARGREFDSENGSQR